MKLILQFRRSVAFFLLTILFILEIPWSIIRVKASDVELDSRNLTLYTSIVQKTKTTVAYRRTLAPNNLYPVDSKEVGSTNDGVSTGNNWDDKDHFEYSPILHMITSDHNLYTINTNIENEAGYEAKTDTENYKYSFFYIDSFGNIAWIPVNNDLSGGYLTATARIITVMQPNKYKFNIIRGVIDTKTNKIIEDSNGKLYVTVDLDTNLNLRYSDSTASAYPKGMIYTELYTFLMYSSDTVLDKLILDNESSDVYIPNYTSMTTQIDNNGTTINSKFLGNSITLYGLNSATGGVSKQTVKFKDSTSNNILVLDYLKALTYERDYTKALAVYENIERIINLQTDLTELINIENLLRNYKTSKDTDVAAGILATEVKKMGQILERYENLRNIRDIIEISTILKEIQLSDLIDIVTRRREDAQALENMKEMSQALSGLSNNMNKSIRRFEYYVSIYKGLAFSTKLNITSEEAVLLNALDDIIVKAAKETNPSIGSEHLIRSPQNWYAISTNKTVVTSLNSNSLRSVVLDGMENLIALELLDLYAMQTQLDLDEGYLTSNEFCSTVESIYSDACIIFSNRYQKGGSDDIQDLFKQRVRQVDKLYSSTLATDIFSRYTYSGVSTFKLQMNLFSSSNLSLYSVGSVMHPWINYTQRPDVTIPEGKQPLTDYVIDTDITRFFDKTNKDTKFLYNEKSLLGEYPVREVPSNALTQTFESIVLEADIYNSRLVNSSDNINNKLNTIYYRTKLFFQGARSGGSLEGKNLDQMLAITLTDNQFDTASKLKSINTVNIGQVNNMHSYIMFINVLNELYDVRTWYASSFALLEKDKEGSTTNVEKFKASNELMAQLKYMIEIKSAIDYLQAYTSVSEVGNLAPTTIYGAIAYDSLTKVLNEIWYEPINGIGSPSMEDLYQTVMSYKIDISSAFSYTAGAETEPLREFFNYQNPLINTYLAEGIVQSATFIPLRTNVYDPYVYADIASDEFVNFHYKFGYYRKAIFIDTNSKAGTELHNTGRRGTLRVATLEDLIKLNLGDVVLYADDNFYNIQVLADAYDKEYSRLDSGDNAAKKSGNWFTNLWTSVKEFFSLTMMEIAKTNDVDKYTKKLEGIADYSETKKEYFQRISNPSINDDENLFTEALNKATNLFKKIGSSVTTPHNLLSEKHFAVLDGYQIDEQLDWRNPETLEYSVMTPFAFVSAVYRSGGLFRFMTSGAAREPIFVSSPNLAYVVNANTYELNSLMNYATLRNLSKLRTLSYETNLDLESPVYLDIYGNIITESGYVVIPAAANATLNKEYTPMTAAFLSVYGKDYKLPEIAGEVIKELNLENFFQYNERDKDYGLSPSKLDGLIDITHVSTGDKSTMQRLKDMYAFQFINMGDPENKVVKFDIKKYIKYVFMEVVRGAPLENIDKDKEGINPARRLSVGGIVAAVKLDELKASLGTSVEDSNSTLLNLPNPAFMPGVEYIVLFVYKIMSILTIVLILVQIAILGIKGKVGMDIIMYLITTVVTVTALVFFIPKSYEISYYQTNRNLLQAECMKLAIYNLEKREQGVELGMTSVTSPPEGSTLLLKITDIHIPWYELFSKIITAPVVSSLGKIYSDYLDTDAVALKQEFQVINDGVYIDVYDLLASTKVDIDTDFHTLQFSSDSNTPASFFTPYYYFLALLTNDVNEYNRATNVHAYTTSIYNGGKLKSLGVIENYFMSEMFLEDNVGTNSERYDMFAIRSLYELEGRDFLETPFIEEDFALMRQSLWYNDNIAKNISQLDKRADKLDTYARDFVKKHKNLIGACSDETFLKFMALDLAMYYNKLFSIDSCDSFELYKLQPDDILRVSIAKEDKVMEGVPYSFSRYIYSISGQAGVYVAAILDAIIFVSNILKPIFTFGIFIAVFMSLFVYKMILRKDEASVSGYLFITGLLLSLNVIYALLLKLTFMLPSLGLTPMMCMLCNVLIQAVTVALYFSLLLFVVKHWRDLGNGKIREVITNTIEKIKVPAGISEAINNSLKHSKDGKSDNPGWDQYQKMKEADEARKNVIGSDSSRDDPFGRNNM